MNGSEYYIFLYDVTDKSSFSSLKEWLDFTKPKFNINCSRILCGNKIDLNYKRVIPKIDGELFSAENNMKYFETSIITGEGIDELFNMIIENTTQKIKKEYNINNNLNSNINKTKNKKNQKKNKKIKENKITIGSNIEDNSNLVSKPNNDFEQIINKEKLENQNLLKRINELESELTKEKNINLKLNEKINIFLTEELNNEKNKNLDEKKNDTIKGNEENKSNKLIELYEQISNNQKEINELKSKLSRFPFELLKDEKIMSVIISSNDKKIQSAIICKNTDIFCKLEEKLYQFYPGLKKTEHNFNINGNKINKYYNMDENGIVNNDVIFFE